MIDCSLFSSENLEGFVIAVIFELSTTVPTTMNSFDKTFIY